MKKLLGISIIAVLAVAPVMASAAEAGKVDLVPVDQTSNELVPTTNVASTSYVQGAYNVLGEAINAIDTRTDTLESDVGTLQTTVGNSGSGLVKGVADNAAAITVLNGDASTTGSVAKAVADAVSTINDTTSGLNTRVTANENAITTLNGADTVDGSVAKSVKTAKESVETKLTAGATGYDINANSLQVQGVNVLTAGSALNDISNGAIAKEKLAQGVQDSLGKADQAQTDIGTMSGLTTTEKASLVGAINEVDAHTDTNTTAIANITSGDTVVGKATADASGNVITTTYATKTELSTAEAAAKAYAKDYADQKLVQVYTTWNNANAKGTVALVDTPEQPGA